LETAYDEISPVRVVLGGRFGEEDSRVSYQRLDRFAARGGRLVDTAHSYAEGRSEKIIGKWLRANPGHLLVATKVGHPDVSGTLDLSQPRLLNEAARSCRRLGLPAVDLLLLHRDDPGRSAEELADTLVQLVASGHARRIGICNWAEPRLVQLTALLGERGHVPVVSYQLSLATAARPLWPGTLAADRPLLELVNRHRLPLLAWAGQARGFFAGTKEPLGDGFADPFDTPANRLRRRRCRELAGRIGSRPESVALAWTLHIPGTWPVIGARSTHEVDVSLDAVSLRFDERTLEWLMHGGL
jgi:aryl-alcohol dehydrogenase-like predicted oxidoreductase